VLDLACGAGLARIAVAQRMLTREICYTGIDSNRSRLEKVDWLTRVAAKRGQVLAGGDKVAMNVALGDAYALNGRVRERFVRTALDLSDPNGLAAQLGALLGKERFDEVHVHLLRPDLHRHQPIGPKVLRVIARYLRAGARLYHLFQDSSPFFDFRPGRLRPSRQGLCPAPETPTDAIGHDEARFRQAASQAGLVLDKCGHRWEKTRSRSDGWTIADGYKNWVTRRFTGAEPDWRTAETYQRLAEQYSDYSRYASHFVILRKGERRAAVRRRARPKRLTRI
jgi:hypothetical protein